MDDANTQISDEDQANRWCRTALDVHDRLAAAVEEIKRLREDNDRYFSALASIEMLNQGAEDAMSRWAASGEHHDAYKALRVQVDNNRKVVEAALKR